MNCQSFQYKMPDLLAASRNSGESSLSSGDRAHLASCVSCREELDSLRATFVLLDSWQAPEPSAYFDQKLAVLLREEQAKPPANWWERLQSHLLFNTGRQFRPALAGIVAFALLVGGGTFAGISNLPLHQNATQVSATVDDLQILDKDAQAIQQMDQLLQDDQPVDDSSPVTPRT